MAKKKNFMPSKSHRISVDGKKKKLYTIQTSL